MGKVKNQNRSELEFLRGENRKLRSELRRLQKLNKNLDRKSHFYENIVEDSAEDIEIAHETCGECGKGNLIITELPHIDILVCSTCEHRTIIKKK